MVEWETIKMVIDKRPDSVQFGLTRNLDTELHVATTTKKTTQTIYFVKNLVNLMTSEELELKNIHSNTAFWEAAAIGNNQALKIMMAKYPRILLVIILSLSI
ncbi:hypothetical protein Hanom_Chr17g01555041 [Helianthus anomalus]